MRLTEKQQEIYEELFVRYPVLERCWRPVTAQAESFWWLETAEAARTRSTLSGN